MRFHLVSLAPLLSLNACLLALDDFPREGATIPDTCFNDAQDDDEPAPDCGGPCGPCAEGEACFTDDDCAPRSCISQICTAAYKRSSDDAVLLAHYSAMTFLQAYDPAAAQVANTSGGQAAPAGWFPTPTSELGHLDLGAHDPSGRELIFECGEGSASIIVSTSSLFGDFSGGVKGTAGAAGNPGWGVVASVGTGQGRSSHNLCGSTSGISANGGIAVCNGGGGANSWMNHLVSYTTDGTGLHGAIGCGGSGCDCDGTGCTANVATAPSSVTAGNACDLEVWIWMK